MGCGHPRKPSGYQFGGSCSRLRPPLPILGSIVTHALVLAPDEPPLPANAPILTEDALDDDFLYEAIFAHVSDVTVKTSITGRNIENTIES